VRREFSAGGVLVRRLRGQWMVAAIRPGGKPEGVWALPKGLVDAGEPPAETALREVEEETGARGRLGPKLGDVRYVYTWPKGAEGARSSGRASSASPATLPTPGERVFKVVSFYLVRYSGGRLGDVPAAFRHEVAEVRWLPLEDAPRLLAYGGERQIAEKALAMLLGEGL
jgi:8-oxo-dGTP pyrophosphatase MutT (NUDIX family)